MAKILTFRNKDGAPSDQDFLSEEDQTLSFRTDEDGGVSLGNMVQADLPNLFPDPKKDWSNQELADLFRVRQLLSGANVAVETDRGVTDEGDPWFVFCHGNGEVFIHLCRINGMYLLDSPNVLRPLRGADFSELIADFTNQALPARGSEDETERRVIRLERGGKVRLHPSAMLAALIWTLFLASEELVLLAPEEPAFDDDALLDFDGMFAVDTADMPVEDLAFHNTSAEGHNLLKDEVAEAEHAAAETHGQLREAMLQQQGLTVQNNTFTMGLSTIAIAMGFMSETVLLDSQRKVLQNLKELGFSEYGADAERVAELEIPADEEGSARLAMLADFLGLDLSLNTDLAEAPQGDTRAMLAQQDLAHLTEDLDTGDLAVPGVVKAAVQPVRKDDVDAETAVELAEDTRANTAEDVLAPAVGDDTLAADATQDDTLMTLSQLVQTWQPDMAEFQLGQTTIKTSFDISSTDAFALFDLIDYTGGRTTSFEEFDALAQRLIDFIESKEGDFGIIELENEIIMLDRTAVTGGEIDYLNWETEDGKIITLVGLASDFQQFDMIA